MKNFLILAGSIFSVVSFASSDVGATPNKFDCVGENNTQVSYTSTSFVGKPTMSVTFRGKTAKIGSMPEIKSQQTLLGTLLTATDNSMVPVDGPSVRYTFVLPKVTLRDDKPTEFQAVVVRTSVANPFFRPTPYAGAIENNQVEELKCEAERVFF